MYAIPQKGVEKKPLIFNPMCLCSFLLPRARAHTHTHTHIHTTQVTQPKDFGQFIAELLFLRKQSAGRGNLALPLMIKEGHGCSSM